MKIITDTSSLVSIDEAERLGITVLPVCVSIDGKTYKEYKEINSKEFIKLINEGGKPTSSQPSIGDIMEAFDTDEETIVLSVGDGLSGTYANSVGIKNTMTNNSHIHIIDSKTLAGALHYLVEKTIKLKNRGSSLEFIKKELYQCIESSHFFVIPCDFDFLKRSGRLTPIASKILSLTKVIPVLTQSESKRAIEVFTIKRTIKKAILSVIDHLKELNIEDNYIISICHADGYDKAMQAYTLLKNEFKNSIIEIFELSPALCAHGGPGSLTIQAIKM